MAYYRQPEFFRDFRCLGGDCPYNCCCFWRIVWTKEEYEKLKSSECSSELRELIEIGFVSCDNGETDLMRIRFIENNSSRCPFLSKEGWCRIQLELGEEYLSETCINYPRTCFKSGDTVYRTCLNSCHRVTEILYNDDNAMQLVNVPIKTPQYVKQDKSKLIEEHPEWKYRNELFDFFYEIISSKKRSIETSLVLGGLSAQKINEYISYGKADQIPQMINILRPQTNICSISSFDSLKPNYGISLGLVGKAIGFFAETNVLDSISENGKLSADKYEEARSILKTYLDQKQFFLRNLALNFYIQGEMPFYYNNKSLLENYCYFALTVAVAKLICAASVYRDKCFASQTLTLLSFYARGMYHHTDEKFKAVLQLLEENNINSSAKIALMLK